MEYENRHDADDAYHEMHNKRIGRDDLLKIEVSSEITPILPARIHGSNYNESGPALLHLLLGVSTLAGSAVRLFVVSVPHAVDL